MVTFEEAGIDINHVQYQYKVDHFNKQHCEQVECLSLANIKVAMGNI